MNLFAANNLSQRRPEFTPLTDAIVTSEISALLEQHYDLTSLNKICVICGPNISSRNFKIETDLCRGGPPWPPVRGDKTGAATEGRPYKDFTSAKLFLKARGTSDQETMLSEAQLTFALSELGQRVPRIIRSSDGELVTSHADRCWVLYEFQEGDYFSGQDNELQAAAEAFGELSVAAINLFPKFETGAELFPGGLADLLDRETKYSKVAELCGTHRE